MEDWTSHIYDLALAVVLEELLRAMLKKQILTVPELRDLLEKSGSRLLSMRTEVSVAASEHIRALGVGLGVVPATE